MTIPAMAKTFPFSLFFLISFSARIPDPIPAYESHQKITIETQLKVIA